MRYLLLTFLALVLCCPGSKAQTAETIPNYKLAGEIMMIHEKAGLPVDSAAVYLKDFERLAEAKPSETVFKSRLDADTYIIFQKDGNNLVQVIICVFPDTFLTTAQKAIAMMGMVASGTAAPPGFTAYATPKYAAFLNPQVKPGQLSLVLVQGGK
jgi:hypothetical protein